MAEQSISKKSPLVIDPDVEIGVVVRDIVGHMGAVEEIGGGFKIKVHHGGAFPWDELFKALLYRDYKVAVTRHKAELFVEAAV
jgi:hypothetical protein